jgi:hypothetical protein
MITLLIWVLVLILVMAVCIWIITQIGLPEPMGKIAMAIVGLIFILVLLSLVLGEIPLRPMLR